MKNNGSSLLDSC